MARVPPREGYLGSLSPAQEAALSDLIKQAPEAFNSAHLQGNDLVLWGVDLDSLSANTSIKQKVVLLKFLRARKFDAEQALIMLVACLKWRREFDITGLVSEQFPECMDPLGMVYGRSKDGDPVTYNFYGNFNADAVFGGGAGSSTFVRWRIQLMEKAVQQLDFEAGIEQVLQVHDYSGANMFRLNPNVKAATKSIIKIFQDNYPELLSAKLFLNVPTVMEFVFGLFSTMADVETRKKFQMVRSGRSRAVLLEYISATQLPQCFGGFQEFTGLPTSSTPSTSAADAKPSPPSTQPPDSAASAAPSSVYTVIELPPSGKQEVRLAVPAASGTLKWAYVTAGGAATASVSFAAPDGSGGKAAAASPTAAAEDARGSLVCEGPGVATLLLDNKSMGWISGYPLTAHVALQFEGVPKA